MVNAISSEGICDFSLDSSVCMLQVLAEKLLMGFMTRSNFAPFLFPLGAGTTDDRPPQAVGRRPTEPFSASLASHGYKNIYILCGRRFAQPFQPKPCGADKH